MSDYSTDDAVKFAIGKDAAQFKTAVNDILSQKISDALELKRVEVAHGFMSPKVESEPVVEPVVEPVESQPEEVSSDEKI